MIAVFASIENDGTHKIFKDYIAALDLAGAIPVVVGYTDDGDSLRELAERCDGFCFTGGVDVHPSYYGESVLPECDEIQAERDSLEMRAIPIAMATGKPILGICRGAQVINVALGGTLYQDIPSIIPGCLGHSQKGVVGPHDYFHEADVTKGTPLYELAGAGRIKINSFHHQAVKDIGAGLAPMAKADDGVIEALYGTSQQYIRLYQWHPERLIGRDALERALFSDFTNACMNK